MTESQGSTRIDQYTFLNDVSAELSQRERNVETQIPKRKVVLPVLLFLATCLSTFFVGCCQWSPERAIITSMTDVEGDLTLVRRMIFVNWWQGLVFMLCLMSILFAHEMGHFIGTLIYKIPASLPFFVSK